MKKEELTGGRIGKIYKEANYVIRPSNEWTQHVHSFLSFMIEKGADFVPKPISISGEKEVISYMEGEVFNYPLPEKLLTDDMIVSVANLLLKYHKCSEKYVCELTNHEQWMLPANYPVEVICHGDYAPYNITIVNDEAK